MKEILAVSLLLSAALSGSGIRAEEPFGTPIAAAASDAAYGFRDSIKPPFEPKIVSAVAPDNGRLQTLCSQEGDGFQLAGDPLPEASGKIYQLCTPGGKTFADGYEYILMSDSGLGFDKGIQEPASIRAENELLRDCSGSGANSNAIVGDLVIEGERAYGADVENVVVGVCRQRP